MSEHSNPQSQSLLDRPVQPKWKGACDSLPPDGYVVERGESVIQDQFMVTGVSGQIDQIVDGLSRDRPDLNLPQEPIEEIDLGFLSALPPAREPEIRLRFEDEQLKDLVTRVYRLAPEVRLEEVIEAFYERALGPPPRPVFAEPNYLTSGSPGCVEGGPAGIGVAGGGEGLFWKQWAFGEDGIARPSSEMEPSRNDVRVAVFDTSPFSSPGKWHIWWMKRKPLNLCVWHPKPSIDLVPTGLGIPRQGGVAADGQYLDHGLFVSSMVHAVASQSHIYLIRVLNGHNLGDLPTLVKALCEFLLRDSADRGGTLNGTVLNLSLGLKDEPGSDRPLLRRVRSRISDLEQTLGFVSSLSPDEIPAVCLEIVLSAARRAGAIVVASAGNGSSHRQAEHTETPACYPFVIGVAGHNRGQRRSNFSNRGNIAAPGGGDGPPDVHPLNPNGTIKNCDDWLVGLSMHSGQPSGYMYWMGTSFAAPQVAGGAARLLLMGEHPGNVRGRIESVAAHSADGNLGNRRFKVP